LSTLASWPQPVLAQSAARSARESSASAYSCTVAPSDALMFALFRPESVHDILRPPIARENIPLVAGDLVRLKLKRPFSDGTFALDLDPLSLLVRLATTVQPPRFHSVRYAGVLAAASQWRPRVVPPAKPPTESDHDHTEHACSTCSAKNKPPTHRSGYRPWRELLMRSFKIDVEHCANCGGRMKLRSLVMTTSGIERYLRWLGESVDPPTRAPARDPPYFKSQVIRRGSASPPRRSCSTRTERALDPAGVHLPRPQPAPAALQAAPRASVKVRNCAATIEPDVQTPQCRSRLLRGETRALVAPTRPSATSRS
jgi:hypothetical protein